MDATVFCWAIFHVVHTMKIRHTSCEDIERLKELRKQAGKALRESGERMAFILTTDFCDQKLKKKETKQNNNRKKELKNKQNTQKKKSSLANCVEGWPQ